TCALPISAGWIGSWGCISACGCWSRAACAANERVQILHQCSQVLRQFLSAKTWLLMLGVMCERLQSIDGILSRYLGLFCVSTVTTRSEVAEHIAEHALGALPPCSHPVSQTNLKQVAFEILALVQIPL